MKIIEYDAQNGEPIPDGLCRERALAFLKGEVDTITVSSEVFCNWIRVMVHDRRVPADQVQFLYQGELLPINRHGRLPHRPAGFCDAQETTLMRLLAKPPDSDYPL